MKRNNFLRADRRPFVEHIHPKQELSLGAFPREFRAFDFEAGRLPRPPQEDFQSVHFLVRFSAGLEFCCVKAQGDGWKGCDVGAIVMCCGINLTRERVTSTPGCVVWGLGNSGGKRTLEQIPLMGAAAKSRAGGAEADSSHLSTLFARPQSDSVFVFVPGVAFFRPSDPQRQNNVGYSASGKEGPLETMENILQIHEGHFDRT